ncbi:transketolase [Chloroflexota bacterium]
MATDIKTIKQMAARIRRDIVEMIGGEGHVGHLGGSCSSADIVAALYLYKMKQNPQNPKWEDRDKFLMSKGHSCLAQYAVLAELGYFPKEKLSTLKSLGSMLQGHPDVNKTPGIEANTGSLGHGLSIANGMALAMRLDKKDGTVYCILGDAELAEGQVWEAAMAAAYYKIDNIVAIVDQNGLSASGFIKERFDINLLPEKWNAFGWHVIEIDGHSIDEIVKAFDAADEIKGKPTVIIANTVKGKGISFAENVVGFHSGAMTKDQYKTALKECDLCIAEYN